MEEEAEGDGRGGGVAAEEREQVGGGGGGGHGRVAAGGGSGRDVFKPVTGPGWLAGGARGRGQLPGPLTLLGGAWRVGEFASNNFAF